MELLVNSGSPVSSAGRRSSFRNDFICYGMTELINKMMPFLLLPVMARVLNPAEFGHVAMFETLHAVSLVVVSLGVSGAIKVFYFRYPGDEFARFLGTLIVLSTLFSLAVVALLLCLPELQRWLLIPSSWVALAVVAALAEAINVARLTLWQVEQRPLHYGGYRVAQTALNMGLSLYLVLPLQLSWQGRAGGIAVASVLFALLSLVLMSRERRLHIWPFTGVHLHSILKFGLPLIPHGLSAWSRTGIDRLLLSAFAGGALIGSYAAAFQISLVLFTLGRIFRTAWEPRMLRALADHDPASLLQLTRLFLLLWLIVAALACAVAVAAEPICRLMLGSDYPDSPQLLYWAVIGQAFLAMKVADVQVMHARRTAILGWISLLTTLLHLVLGYLALRHWGVVALVQVSALTFLLGFMLTQLAGQICAPLPYGAAVGIRRCRS